MNGILKTLIIVLILWLIIYIFLEIKIIYDKKKKVDNLFSNLDDFFIKRFGILTKMIDIVKAYDKNQFDNFGSMLYDYINNYNSYDKNKRLLINEKIDVELRKLLLMSKVYPEIMNVSRYVKLEKQLIRYSKIINKVQIKYNRSLDIYYRRKKIFPSSIFYSIFRFYEYNYFNLKK